MLLERKRISAAKAVAKLVALQAQYAPSPYVALWSRVEGFRKEQLSSNRAIVKGGSFRTTLHVMARAEYPYIVASYIESGRGRSEGLGVDLEALRAAIPDRPVDGPELTKLAERVLGTDDFWTISFAYRSMPLVRTGPVGPWPHTKPSPVVLWREPLPGAEESSTRVVRQYLAAYGPATRDDIVQFTGFKIRQITPALEGLRERDGFYDVPRAPTADERVHAPVRFLPAFDSIILAHRDRARIVPPEYIEAVFNQKNATTKNTFTVNGFVAGAWRIEKRKLMLDSFAPLPLKWRREVEAEGERLLAWYLA